MLKLQSTGQRHGNRSVPVYIKLASKEGFSKSNDDLFETSSSAYKCYKTIPEGSSHLSSIPYQGKVI